MMEQKLKKVNWRPLIVVVLSFVIALAIGALFVLFQGYNPWEVYKIMFQGGFVGSYSIMNTLQRATPLILSSLAVLVAVRTGTFNMGVEGQLLLGAVTAAWVGSAWKGLPAVIHLPLSILLAMAAGALYALIPAILKFKYKVNEIISTIMLNTIAALFTGYLVNHPIRETAYAPQTAKVLVSARLPRLVNYAQVNYGLFIAIFCTLFFWYLFNKTTFGYRIKMVGDAEHFAEYAGINPVRTAFLGMLISGAMAGLAGSVEVLGVHYRFFDPFVAGLGFNGILISWLGKGSPIGVLLAALFYGGMQNGSLMADMLTDIPRQLADTLLAIVIFFMAAEGIFDWLWILRGRRKSGDVREEGVSVNA